VKHRASRKFWKCHDALPREIQTAASRAFVLLKHDERHPSLQLKKLLGNPYWSVRINDNYRALAVRSDDAWVWFWMGTHGEYDRILKQR
jgi:hypothetical protein